MSVPFHGMVNFRFDALTGTTTVTGGNYIVQQPGGGGLLLHEAGILRFSPSGVFMGGPHPFETGDTDALCAALTPVV